MDRSDVNSHIGRRLRTERRLRQITQKELAYVCGVTFQQIHKYEQGIVTISAGTLWKLAEALSISVAELFPRMDGAELFPRMGGAEPARVSVSHFPR